MPVVAAGFPAGCCPGALGLKGRMRLLQGLGGLWVLLLLLGSLSVRAVNYCFFGGLCFATGSICWCGGFSIPWL